MWLFMFMQVYLENENIFNPLIVSFTVFYVVPNQFDLLSSVEKGEMCKKQHEHVVQYLLLCLTKETVIPV